MFLLIIKIIFWRALRRKRIISFWIKKIKSVKKRYIFIHKRMWFDPQKFAKSNSLHARWEDQTLKRAKILSSGMAIILVQKSAKIRFMHISLYFTHILYLTFMKIREKFKFWRIEKKASVTVRFNLPFLPMLSFFGQSATTHKEISHWTCDQKDLV